MRGAVLIEVVVAIAILGVAGSSMLGYVRALSDGQSRIFEREREVRRAEMVLIEHVTMSASQLSQRLGVRPATPFVVWIDRPEPELFRIGVAPADLPTAELLSTLVHKPDSVGEVFR